MPVQFRLRILKRWPWWTLLALLCVPAARADCVDSRVISLFPRDISEFACANLEEVRLQPWFADFKGQVLPRELYGLDQFLISAGINPNSQVKQVAWSIGASAPARVTKAASGSPSGLPEVSAPAESIPDADQFLAVIVGHFDVDSIQSALDGRNLAVITVAGHTLYPIATGGPGTNTYFMAVDSGTVAVGERSMLRNLIAITQGAAESLLSNTKVIGLVEQVNSDATIWGVFNGPGTRQAIRQLAPGAGQFAESGKLFKDIQSLVMSAKASSSDVEVRFEIATDTPEDSVMLTQILQASLVLRKYLAAQAHPPATALAGIIDEVSVTPNSSLVDLSLDLPLDQLRDLILQRAFSSGN
jgi:hypothetical protein